MIYVTLDEIGCVNAVAFATMPIDDMIPVETDLDQTTVGRKMMVEGELVPRPSLPEFALGSSISLPPLPAQTRLTIRDEIIGQDLLDMVVDLDGWSETIELPDEGEYWITIIPPKPLLHIHKRFSV